MRWRTPMRGTSPCSPPRSEPDLGLTRDSSDKDIRDVALSLLRVNLDYHLALHH